MTQNWFDDVPPCRPKKEESRNRGMVADVFKRIGMPTNPSCYETADQLHRAVLRAYFLGASDAIKEAELKDKAVELGQKVEKCAKEVSNMSKCNKSGG